MKEKILRKKLLEKIKKVQKRLHLFRYLTRNVRKGKYDSLKRLYKIDQNGKIINTYLDWKQLKMEYYNITKIVTSKYYK